MRTVVVVAVILLSALAAGFFFPRRAAPPKIGFIVTRDAAKRPTKMDFESLKREIESELSSGSRGADRLQERLRALEALNSAAASGKMSLLGAGLERGVSGAMNAALDSRTDSLDDWLEQTRAGARAELDALAAPRPEPETPESLQIRYRLLNLKLQLKTLTRDEISFSKARVDEVEKKLEKLEKQEAERRDALARERMENYQAAAGALSFEMENRYNRQRRALEAELNALLDSLDAEMREKLKQVSLETEKTAEKGTKARRALSAFLPAAAPPSRARPEDTLPRASGEFMLAKLKLRAAEVCPALGIDLLLADPVWTTGEIKNHTAQFREKSSR